MPPQTEFFFHKPRILWVQREATLNWLALGMLLAAWNAASDDPAIALGRPDTLRGYSTVSVRAAQLSFISGGHDYGLYSHRMTSSAPNVTSTA